LLSREADADEEAKLTGDDRKEAERNQEAARTWLTAVETVDRLLGVARVVDLSATPFFLSGSGYAEGTLFPWTMSDFSLMDAIECGIVKLPRVPVADNIPGEEMPRFAPVAAHRQEECQRRDADKLARSTRLAFPSSCRQPSKRCTGTTRRRTTCGTTQGSRSAVLHRGLQQHFDIQARLRLHLRLRAGAQRRFNEP